MIAELGMAGAEVIISSVGCKECRPRFQDALLKTLGVDLPKLSEDWQRRAVTNPVRI